MDERCFAESGDGFPEPILSLRPSLVERGFESNLQSPLKSAADRIAPDASNPQELDSRSKLPTEHRGARFEKGLQRHASPHRVRFQTDSSRTIDISSREPSGHAGWTSTFSIHTERMGSRSASRRCGFRRMRMRECAPAWCSMSTPRRRRSLSGKATGFSTACPGPTSPSEHFACHGSVARA